MRMLGHGCRVPACTMVTALPTTHLLLAQVEQLHGHLAGGQQVV